MQSLQVFGLDLATAPAGKPAQVERPRIATQQFVLQRQQPLCPAWSVTLIPEPLVAGFNIYIAVLVRIVPNNEPEQRKLDDTEAT